ncbi:acid phosphatase 1 isoform X3 [Argentina anserina]|uniref:acid phosphatase 1 isoform X3 n=1 Tax=Argentina anserina TaxID=57926 RepID=UPI0021762BCD|nr:acid phosphatase 1 isoform X3 [Potentilla anserina]
MIFFKLFLIFPFLTLAFSHEAFNPHLLPRPLIIDYPNLAEPHFKEIEAEVKLQCTSWRFSVEANNVNPWKTIPEECVEYVKDYVTGRGYGVDLERVSSDAGVYAKSVELRGDGKDVWVFDVDDTLLSNLPYYADHGYGASDDHGKLATIYKSEKRSEMEKEGYRILGNSGDQWSDLLGSSMSIRSFKLPNPMVLSQNYSRAGWRRNWTTQSADSFLLLYHTDWTTTCGVLWTKVVKLLSSSQSLSCIEELTGSRGHITYPSTHDFHTKLTCVCLSGHSFWRPFFG